MFLKYNFPTILWATVILFLTLLPANAMPPSPEWQLISFYTASHAAVFFMLAFLMLRGFTKQTTYLFLSRNSFWLTLVISVFFGSFIEVLQTTMELGRQGDVMDIVSNSIGTITGLFFFYMVRHNQVFSKLL